MQYDHAIVAHWNKPFDENALREWCENLRNRLTAPEVSLGLVFMSPHYFDTAEQILEIIRVHAQVPLLAGCSGASLVANDDEIEENAGIVLALHYLPGASLKGVHFQRGQIEEANGPGYWHAETDVPPGDTNGWLAFLDPFHTGNPEIWLRQWNEAYAPSPILGGLSSGDFNAHRTQLYLNGDVFEEGGVAVSVGGDVALHSVISQGCTPIGETWTITRTEENVIHEIANRRAYDILVDTFNSLKPAVKKKAQNNIFVGLVMNEYLADFDRGDFLIRNLLGADPSHGALVVGAYPRQGQTIQFQRRDAEAATEDMTGLLASTRGELEGHTIYAGVLHCCNGRGRHLFGAPNHDTGMIQKALGPMPLSGFFCNGEIGPVGDTSFLHGYTASLALFVKKKPSGKSPTGAS